MAVDSALVRMDTSAVDPTVAEAIRLHGQMEALRNVLAPDLNDAELQLFAMVAQRSRLDPFTKQIHAVKRQGKLTFQTGIDGFRSSAEETGEYRGSDEPEYGPILDKPFPHPEWARVVVHRQYPDGSWLHQPATVYWDEFYPGDSQGFQWKRMPRVMLSKCGEAAAFRKAFPRRFGDVYTSEEMHQADREPTEAAPAPTARERAAARLAAVTTAAEPISAPEGSPPGGTSPSVHAPEPVRTITEASGAPDTAGPPPGQDEGEAATSAPSPSPAPTCEAFHPQLGRCTREGEHPANHRNKEGETWK